MAMQTVSYPVIYEQEMPETLSRWLWLFKWLLAIPHWIALSIVGFVSIFIMFIAWLAILITGSYPRGLFDFMVGLERWSARVNAYMMHMTDKYPPFSMQEDDTYPVHVTAEYPLKSNRLTVFFRWILAIPQWIIVSALGNVLSLLWFVNVLIAIFTGKPNPEVFRIMVGINRWTTRVNLYSYCVTDQYPPFSLD